MKIDYIGEQKDSCRYLHEHALGDDIGSCCRICKILRTGCQDL